MFALAATLAPLRALAATLAPLRLVAAGLTMLGVVAVALVAGPVTAQETLTPATAADVTVYFDELGTASSQGYDMYVANRCDDSVKCYDVADIRVELNVRGTLSQLDLTSDTGTVSVSNDNPRKGVWHIPFLRPGHRAQVRWTFPESVRPLAYTDRSFVAQLVANASAPANVDPHPENNKAVSQPVRLNISNRLQPLTPLYGVSVAVDNETPAPGDTVTFTVTSHNYNNAVLSDADYGPGVFDNRSRAISDARVKLELPPGLVYQSHDITRPGWTQSSVYYDPPLANSAYDAVSGVWEIGEYVVYLSERLPPYVLTLTARVAEGVDPSGQCLTATMTAFPAEWALAGDFHIAKDNTARVCLGPAAARVLLQRGPNTSWAIYPCVNKTAYPCTAGTNNLVIGVTGEPINTIIYEGAFPRLAAGAGLPDFSPNPWPLLRAQQVIFHIPDPGGRLVDNRTNSINSGNTVSWQTASAWTCDHQPCTGQHGARDGVLVAMSYVPFNAELSDWLNVTPGLTVRGADGGPPPGLVRMRFSTGSGPTNGGTYLNPAPPSYSATRNTASSLSSTRSTAFSRMLEFEKLGTYALEFTASATRSATGGTPCGGTATCTGSGTSLFHVGPVAELAVRDGGGGSVGAPPGKTGFSIVAVNNGPDAIGAGAGNGLGAQVRVSLPAGARGCTAEDERYNAATGVWNIGTMPAPPRFASPAYNSGQVSEEVLTIVCDGPGRAGQTARAVISNTAPYVVTIDGDRHEGTYLDYYEGNDSVAIRGVYNRPPLRVEEPGVSFGYGVRLASRPRGQVTVGVSADNPAAAVSPELLYFTPENWNTPQNVSVIVPAQSPGAVTLTFRPGLAWRGYPATRRVIGQNHLLGLALSDPEGKAVALAPSFVSNRYDYRASVANHIASVMITPEAPLGAAVTVNGYAVGEGGVEVPLNYRDNEILIVVTPPGASGGDGDGGGAAAGGGSGCTAMGEPCAYTLTIRRAVPPRLAFSHRGITLDEGDTATYTVELDTPILTGPVTIAIASDNPSVSVSPTEVTLRPLDANPRTITVTAVADADRDDERATITHTANGAHYHDVVANVSVRVNDTTPEPPPADPEPTPAPALSVSTTALRIGEGGRQSYTVALATQPAGNATVSIASDNADVTVRPARLTFTTSNWATARSVTASAASDDDAVDDAATLTHTASGGGYGDAPAVRVAVSVTDDDTAGLDINPTVLSLMENGAGAYTVALTSEPSGNVTITIVSDNDDVTVRPASLTFTPANWATAQRVTVIARADEGGGDEIVTLRLTASGGGYAGLSGTVYASVDDKLTPLPAGSVTTMPGAPAGVSVYAPAGAADGVTITVAPPPSDTPTVAAGAGFGIGAAVGISVANAPDDGVEVCMPVSDALRAAAGSTLTLTLLRYAGGVWTEMDGARDLGDRVCAAGISGEAAYAPAYALRPGTVLDLAAGVGDAPGTVVLSWTPPAAGTSQVAVVVNAADDTDYCLDVLPGLGASEYACAGRTPGAAYVALLIVLLPDGGYTLANIVTIELPASATQ